MIVPQAKEATESKHGIRHPAADFIDHHPFNRADLVGVGAVHRGTFDLVAPDQIARFTIAYRHPKAPCGTIAANSRGVRSFH